MNQIDIAQLDLNLLVVFDVLLQECHVTRAAERLHRTQSAVSHALSRLREQLDDAVLVRVGGEMRPTPRAERLAPEVRRLLQAIGRVLSHDEQWNPAASDRVFSLVAPDFINAAFPRLLAMMTEQAPDVGVELVPTQRGMLRDVADGRFDLGIYRGDMASTEGALSEPLTYLPFAVFARHNHPGIPDWNLETWTRYRHIRIRTGAKDRSLVDVVLEEMGRTRKLGPRIPHFMLAPPLLAKSNLLLTVPYGVLADVASNFNLAALPCPIPLRPIELALYSSPMLQQDPAIAWFRSLVKQAICETFADPPELLMQV